MQPSTFPQSNKKLLKPVGMTDEECSSLEVFNDGESNLSCWKPSWKERFSIFFFGTVWLWVFSGSTQPPVSLLGTENAFEDNEVASPEPDDGDGCYKEGL